MPRAQKQLDAILDYVEAGFSAQVAERVEGEFEAAFQMLERFPEAGEAVPGRPGLRKTTVRGMNIVMYRIMEDHVRITAITRRGQP